MFRKRKLVSWLALAALAAFGALSPSQAQGGIDFPGKGKILGAVLKTERTFSSESLYGYMNGGAELYLEYGFDRLAVIELKYRDSDFKLEIFRMVNNESAFGIFSVSVFRCNERDQFRDFSCQSAYQLQVCRGEYYINIINDSGSAGDAAKSSELAGYIVSDISGDPYSLGTWDVGDAQAALKERYVLFKGDIGLYNGAFEWYEILRGHKGYTAISMAGEGEALLKLRFADPMSMNEFIGSKGVSKELEAGEEISLSEDTFLSISETIVSIRRVL